LKVTTRFAPSLSGRLHIGHLVNVLYNYIWAKQNKGTFFLRLDGIKLTGERVSLQNYFLEDLIAFGITPDFVVKQSDRRELYRQKMVELLDRPDVYFCDCSAADITRRASEGSPVRIMSRDEKYPAPSAIVQIKVFNFNKQNVLNTVPGTSISANLSTTRDPIENVLNKDPSEYWQPYDVGYFGDETPIIRIAFEEKTWVQHVTIIYKDYPWREWKVMADKQEVARVIKPNKFCYHPVGGDFPYASDFEDSVSFAPVECEELLIIPIKYMRTVRREYCYDGFCRNRHIPYLDLDKPETVVRTIAHNLEIPDTVLWIYSVADLALTSAIDDQEFRVTHTFRGYDIEPFTLLEAEAGKLINYVPNNIMHGEILDSDYYKFSKFRNSVPAVEYLKCKTPDQILSYLANRAGLIPSDKVLSLKRLVEEAQFNPDQIQRHSLIREEDLLS